MRTVCLISARIELTSVVYRLRRHLVVPNPPSSRDFDIKLSGGGVRAAVMGLALSHT